MKQARKIPHARMPISGRIEAAFDLGEEVYVWVDEPSTPDLLLEQGRIIARKCVNGRFIYDLDLPDLNEWLFEVPENLIAKREQLRQCP